MSEFRNRFVLAVCAQLAVVFYVVAYIKIARGHYGWAFYDVFTAAMFWFGFGPARRREVA